MKCPNCFNEVAEQDSFCWFCGAAIEAKTAMQGKDEQTEAGQKPQLEEVAEVTAPIPIVKKKRVGLILLLSFSVFALLSGSTLGFIIARGLIDWRSLLPIDKFVWTNVSEVEAANANDNESDIVEELNDQKKPAQPSASVSETHDSTETDLAIPDSTENDSPVTEETTETTDETTEITDETTVQQAETTEQAEEPATDHYAKHLGTSLLIVDDKAHVLSESSIITVFDKAKEISAASGYSIVIILTSDLFDMTMDSFAGEYYINEMDRSLEDNDLSSDGFVFLIDAENNEYYLETFGSARSSFPSYERGEFYDIIQPSIDEKDYETALLDLLEYTAQ